MENYTTVECLSEAARRILSLLTPEAVPVPPFLRPAARSALAELATYRLIRWDSFGIALTQAGAAASGRHGMWN